MAIPRNGRYVVRAQLTGFADVTQEVVLNGVQGEAANQGITIVPKATDFGMQLASRVAAEEAQGTGGGMGARGLAGVEFERGWRCGGRDDGNAQYGCGDADAVGDGGFDG